MKISSKLNELKRTDLNCNVFDVYSYDGLSMQELLCQFFTMINECIKVSNETIDLASWLVNEGLKMEVVNKLMLWLNDGTLENLINVNLFNTLHNKIENINSQLEQIENNTPYEQYEKNKSIDFDGKYKHYQGFSNHSKKTYGRYEQATVMSVIANKDNPKPQVLGTDTKGLATYTNRDSVSLYTENTGSKPTLTISSGMTYTDNTATVPYGTNLELIKVGMIIDVGTKVNNDWCVGVIKEINGLELIMEDGFYKVRNDGETPTKVTPNDGLQCRIQMTNKVWVINSNLFVDEGCPGGANMELGVLSNHTNINDVGGIDLINMREATHYGVKVRGVSKGFNDAFISDGNGRHFVGKKGSSSTPLLQGIDSNGKVFEITMDGSLSMQSYKTQTLTSSGALTRTAGTVILNGSNINLTLPMASENRGRIIEILSMGSGNLLTAQPGNGITTPTLQQQQISVAKGSDKRLRALRFFCDGGTQWFQLSDL